MFLAIVKDLCTRKIVGYAFSDRIDTGLTLAALDMAYRRRKPARGLIFHSDRGVQYAARAYRERLVLQPAPADFLCLPAIIPAAGDLQNPACLLHRGPLTLERLDAAVFLLYGFDRMPTDFFKIGRASCRERV